MKSSNKHLTRNNYCIVIKVFFLEVTFQSGDTFYVSYTDEQKSWNRRIKPKENKSFVKGWRLKSEDSLKRHWESHNTRKKKLMHNYINITKKKIIMKIQIFYKYHSINGNTIKWYSLPNYTTTTFTPNLTL